MQSTTSDWEVRMSGLREGDIVWTIDGTELYDHPFTRVIRVPKNTPLVYMGYHGPSKYWIKVLHSENESSLILAAVGESKVTPDLHA